MRSKKGNVYSKLSCKIDPRVSLLLYIRQLIFRDIEGKGSLEETLQSRYAFFPLESLDLPS